MTIKNVIEHLRATSTLLHKEEGLEIYETEGTLLTAIDYWLHRIWTFRFEEDPNGYAMLKAALCTEEA